jgi:CheY-like chemotaxis protein
MVELSRLKQYTVVLAEDDEITRESWAMILSRFCKEVRSAADGVEALELIEARLPDILITDLEMPRMDGMTLVKTLKERYHHLPVIVATAFNDEAHQVPEADAFLTKPIDKEILKETMRQVAREMPLED